MDLIKYFKMGFQKYADFSTRSTRSEFWWFQLGYFLLLVPIVCVIAAMAYSAFGDVNAGGPEKFSRILIGACFFIMIFFLATIIPQIAITVRRLHDAGQSGWLYLLTMAPYIGTVAWVIFGVLETEQRENKWGPVPGSEKEITLENALVDFDDDGLL